MGLIFSNYVTLLSGQRVELIEHRPEEDKLIIRRRGEIPSDVIDVEKGSRIEQVGKREYIQTRK